MNRQTLVQRIKKWQSELPEFLDWAEKEKNGQVSRALKTVQAAFSSLLNSESQEHHLPAQQNEFWLEDSKQFEMDQMLDRVISKISKLKLPKI